MNARQTLIAIVSTLGGAMIAAVVAADTLDVHSTPRQVKNIVLVQGAIADGSSWSKVIPQLQAKGYHVTAVQNPVTSPAANEASAPFGITPGQQQIRVDDSHFAYMTDEGILDDFAKGLPMDERRDVLAVQGLNYGPAFDEKLTIAAWKTKPSWYVISSKDRMLPPAMETAAAGKMKATTTTLPTCHLAMLEQPEKVAEAIEDAAKQSIEQ